MKTLYVLLQDGFEEVEALTIVDYLRRAEIEVFTVSLKDDLFVESAHNIVVKADKLFSELNLDKVEMVFVPGGLKATEVLRKDKRVLELLNKLNDEKSTIVAICAGPTVLYDAGILSDKTITSFPGVKDQFKNIAEYSEDRVVFSDNIITSRSAGTAGELAMALIEYMKDKKTRKEIENSIVFNK